MRHGQNIYKRKDGRYEARYIKAYHNRKPKYGYIYARTYAEVKEKLSTIENSLAKNETMPLLRSMNGIQ